MDRFWRRASWVQMGDLWRSLAKQNWEKSHKRGTGFDPQIITAGFPFPHLFDNPSDRPAAVS
jgi:hypothetical protein